MNLGSGSEHGPVKEDGVLANLCAQISSLSSALGTYRNRLEADAKSRLSSVMPELKDL